MDNYSMAASDALTAEEMAVVGGVLGIYGATLMFVLSVFLFIFIFMRHCLSPAVSLITRWQSGQDWTIPG